MSTIQEMYDQYIDEVADMDARRRTPTWDPEGDDDDHILGKVAGFRSEVGPNNSDMITLFTVDGVLGVWVSKLLKDEIEGKGVSVGDVVGIKFGGTRESEAGREYGIYGLKVLERGTEDETEDLVPF